MNYICQKHCDKESDRGEERQSRRCVGEDIKACKTDATLKRKGKGGGRDITMGMFISTECR